jgi:hypothetical protein
MRLLPRCFAISLVSLSLWGCSLFDVRPKIRVRIDGSATPWTSLDALNDPKNFQFLIVTDRTGAERPGVFDDAIPKINLLQPEFVVSVGDLIEGYTEDVAQVEREWDEFDAFVRQLEMPFFYLVGNHDYTNQVMADIWKQRYGPSYYHFVYKGVLFLCLNSEEKLDSHKSTALFDEQFEYFRGVLEDHPDVRWTLVFTHKPIWLYEKTARWPDFEKLLAGRPHSVFAGHHHNYVKYVRNDQNYIMLATTGGGSQLRGVHYGEFDHVVWVTMTDDGPILANLMLEGIWDENVRTEDDLSRLEGLIKSLRHEFEAMDTSGLKCRIRNDSDLTWEFECRVLDHPAVSSSTEVRMELAPNSLETFEIQHVVDCDGFDEKKQIILYQSFTTSLDGEPDLVVERQIKLPLCVTPVDD